MSGGAAVSHSLVPLMLNAAVPTMVWTRSPPFSSTSITSSSLSSSSVFATLHYNSSAPALLCPPLPSPAQLSDTGPRPDCHILSPSDSAPCTLCYSTTSRHCTAGGNTAGVGAPGDAGCITACGRCSTPNGAYLSHGPSHIQTSKPHNNDTLRQASAPQTVYRTFSLESAVMEATAAAAARSSGTGPSDGPTAPTSTATTTACFIRNTSLSSRNPDPHGYSDPFVSMTPTPGHQQLLPFPSPPPHVTDPQPCLSNPTKAAAAAAACMGTLAAAEPPAAAGTPCTELGAGATSPDGAAPFPHASPRQLEDHTGVAFGCEVQALLLSPMRGGPCEALAPVYAADGLAGLVPLQLLSPGCVGNDKEAFGEWAVATRDNAPTIATAAAEATTPTATAAVIPSGSSTTSSPSSPPRHLELPSSPLLTLNLKAAACCPSPCSLPRLQLPANVTAAALRHDGGMTCNDDPQDDTYSPAMGPPPLPPSLAPQKLPLAAPLLHSGCPVADGLAVRPPGRSGGAGGSGSMKPPSQITSQISAAHRARAATRIQAAWRGYRIRALYLRLIVWRLRPPSQQLGVNGCRGGDMGPSAEYQGIQKHHFPPIPDLPDVSLFSQLGRPSRFHAPPRRVWFELECPRRPPPPPSAHGSSQRTHGSAPLTLRVLKRAEVDVAMSEVERILAGGFWRDEPQLPAAAGAGAGNGRDGQGGGSGNGDDDATGSGAGQTLSLYMQARMRQEEREAEEALQMLSYEPHDLRHLLGSLRGRTLEVLAAGLGGSLAAGGQHLLQRGQELAAGLARSLPRAVGRWGASCGAGDTGGGRGGILSGGNGRGGREGQERSCGLPLYCGSSYHGTSTHPASGNPHSVILRLPRPPPGPPGISFSHPAARAPTIPQGEADWALRQPLLMVVDRHGTTHMEVPPDGATMPIAVNPQRYRNRCHVTRMSF